MLDIDGTLVDSNYQHALAWYRAFRLHGMTIPVWRCHRAIGMGGDQLVRYLAGDGFEAEHGDDVRTEEHALFAQMIAEVQPFDGRARPHRGPQGAAAARSSWRRRPSPRTRSTTSTCSTPARSSTAGRTPATSRRTKPAPDLVEAALEQGGRRPRRAHRRLDVGLQGREGREGQDDRVRTGGFGVDELRDAGAIAVFESIAELRERLDETPFGGA